MNIQREQVTLYFWCRRFVLTINPNYKITHIICINWTTPHPFKIDIFQGKKKLQVDDKLSSMEIQSSVEIFQLHSSSIFKVNFKVVATFWHVLMPIKYSTTFRNSRWKTFLVRKKNCARYIYLSWPFYKTNILMLHIHNFINGWIFS